MRSGPWRGTAVTAALAVVAILLAWCAATVQAAEKAYEGYGPIENQLQVNNPPIPLPIGPKLLRDNIPGVADEMRTWPAFFRDLELNLHLRSYYMNRKLPFRPPPPSGPDTFNQEAWALGGSLALQSGWLLDFFRMGAAAYTSQPAYAPESRDGTGLLGPGQTAITVPGQAWAQLRYKDYALLTGYRQLVNQGWVNPQDNRMIPNTFEGATVTGEVGLVEYYAGYLTAMKQRNSDTFINMAQAAGVTTDQNRGLVLTSLKFTVDKGPSTLSPLSGLEVYLGNYFVPDVLNTLYLNPEYRRALTEDWRVRFGVQFFDQRSVGSELLGSFSTWNVGARVEVGWRGLAVFAMMSVTEADAGIRSPYGAFPGYISLIAADFNLANEKAWEIGVSYDWGTTLRALKVPGLWTQLLYAEGFDIKAQAQNVAAGKRREADFFTIYRPPKVPGLQFRFLASTIQQEPESRLFYDFRIILDWERPLF